MLMNSVPKVCRLVSYNSRNYLFGQKYKEITNYSCNYLSIDKHHYCNKSVQLINYSQKAANKMSNTQSSTATTSKQDDSVHKHVNRLANEKSPYLLQHAHNPVDWYPWCDEAIERSKAENKLIFLSVGYSTCHWCHVMETESFEDEKIAKILNENFINIKVDREERPDIDKIYMNYVVTLNGSGGWPMSVWLTPNLLPVTSGTYFPPNDRWGMPSFKTVLLKIIEIWKNMTPDQTEQLQSIFEALLKHSLRQIKSDGSTTSGGAASIDSLDNFEIEEKFRQAMNLYKANLDKTWGGFSKKGPKFPEVSKLLLLLHGQIQQSNQNILPVAIETLNKISNGGIHDHIFGGFARYSVDEKWHVPHFEKMLYDQGQLLMAYSIAYKITRNPKYLMVADKIFQYCNKDLKNTNGGFYSGEDADSYPNEQSKKKIEGAFYAWTWSEIRDCCDDNKSALLSIAKNAFDIYCSYYGVTETGNVEPASDPHGHLTAKNILMITNDVEDIVKKYDVTTDEIEKITELVNDKLHEIRDQRPRPHLDTKIITSWNGLLMSGLSKLACCKESENKKAYLEAAEKQMQFIKKHLYDPKSHTLLRSCYGESIESNEISVLSIPIKGFLDDYAFLIKGLLDYYIVTMDLDLLYWAKELQNTQDQLFWDPESGGYYYSQENAQIGRLKDDHDGAEPCGNSISANNLLLLSGYFEDKNYREKVKKIYEFYKDSKPFGYVFPEMLSSMLLYDNGLTMIVVVGPTEKTETNDLLNCIREFYIPGLLLIHLDPENIGKITRPSAANFKSVNDQPTVYLCQNKVCQLPITSCENLHESLSLKYIFK